MSTSLPSLPSILKYLEIFSITATILSLVIILILQTYTSIKKKQSTPDLEQSHHEDWAWDAQVDDEISLHILDTEFNPPAADQRPLENFGNQSEVAQAHPPILTLDRRLGLDLERENSKVMSRTEFDLKSEDIGERIMIAF